MSEADEKSDEPLIEAGYAVIYEYAFSVGPDGTYRRVVGIEDRCGKFLPVKDMGLKE